MHKRDLATSDRFQFSREGEPFICHDPFSLGRASGLSGIKLSIIQMHQSQLVYFFSMDVLNVLNDDRATLDDCYRTMF